MMGGEGVPGVSPMRDNGAGSPVRSIELRIECLRAAETRLWVGRVEVDAEREGLRGGLAGADGGPIRVGIEGA